jgi:hypothetical protein
MRKRRDIPWNELAADASRLDDVRRSKIGHAWRMRMEQEHLAVGAFAMLALELAEDGCDAIVLELIAQASADEVRHAEICRRMAVAFLGEAAVAGRLRGVPTIPPMKEHEELNTRVLFHVVEMSCMSETLTGVYLTEMHARAKNTATRAALESLLEDEIDHGRAGWAYLNSRKGDPAFETLASGLPRLIARTVQPVVTDAARRPEPDDSELEALGYLGRDTGAAIYHDALREVLFRGFEAAGIDVSAARGYADANRL